MKIFKEGLGEGSTFAGFHPAVNLIFFLFAIGITMFSMSPAFLAVTLFFSWAYSIILSGKKAVKTNLLFTVPVIIIMAIINTLFNHNGATVLFYLTGNRITLEAFVSGVVGALLLSSVIIWFGCFNVIMSSDKLIYILGKAAPVLGLTLSMIFRFIPLLKSRFKEIHLGQRCMGRHAAGGRMARLRQGIKEVSILVSWSLEAAIETSDSMEARGYGLPGRTSFHLFRMKPDDWKVLGLMGVTGIIGLAGCIMGKTSINFYPKIVPMQWNLLMIIIFIAYCLLLSIPIIIDIAGERKWQQ
ncbi:MAG: energy-coupling factor transporter transmembrane protein EcfT [Firmicutes bacterium]|nr:energy-coupling factor transporter transmembrane protein EcfT [Bacillota bacterium]